jgi:O-acetyl-ADP-ribose deacetylase (regulator of RNase III)
MKIQVGNILEEVTSGIILQQVNCQGVMGSGFAKAILDKYPEVYKQFRNLSQRFLSQDPSGASLLGECQLVRVAPDLFVANLFGQQYYGRTGAKYTKYDALDSSLHFLANLKDELNLPIHHPDIGCGLGGGKWSIVSAIISENLGESTTLWVQPKS